MYCRGSFDIPYIRTMAGRSDVVASSSLLKRKREGGRGGRSGCEHRMRRFFARFFSFLSPFPHFFPFFSLSVRRSAFSPVEKCITGRVKRPPKNRRNVRGIVEPRSSTCTRQLGASPSSLFPKKERNQWNPPMGGFEGVVSSRGNGGKEKIRPVISGRRGKTCCKIGIRSSRYPKRFISLIKRNTVIVDTSIRQLVEHRYPIPRGISRSETNSNITSFIYIYIIPFIYTYVCIILLYLREKTRGKEEKRQTAAGKNVKKRRRRRR